MQFFVMCFGLLTFAWKRWPPFSYKRNAEKNEFVFFILVKNAAEGNTGVLESEDVHAWVELETSAPLVKRDGSAVVGVTALEERPDAVLVALQWGRHRQ